MKIITQNKLLISYWSFINCTWPDLYAMASCGESFISLLSQWQAEIVTLLGDTGRHEIPNLDWN